MGTLINIVSVIVGGGAGLFLGGRLPETIRKSVVVGLGLFTLVYGVQLFLKTQNALVVLSSILVGILLGEWWQIETGLNKLGVVLEKRFIANRDENQQTKFVRGFLVSSLLFCVGPMAILGSIQDGLTGDFNLLAVKAVLDGFASLAFASSLGVGVLFSAFVILVYQGSLTLLAASINNVISSAMMNEMSAAGGIILIGIAIGSLLELRPIRAGNMLPALLIAPLLVFVLSLLGIK